MKEYYIEIFISFLVIGIALSFALSYPYYAMFFVSGILFYSLCDAYLKKDL